MAQAKKTGDRGFVRELKTRIEPVVQVKTPFNWSAPVVKPEARRSLQTIKRMENKTAVAAPEPQFVDEHKQNRSSKK